VHHSVFLRRAMAACVVSFSLTQAAAAQEGNAFSKFTGNWRGNGQIVFTNSDAEQMTCRASYLSPQANELSLTLVCATQSYRVEIQSRLTAEGHEVQGNWTETTHQVTGNIVGRIASSSFEGSISGPGFSGEMSLRVSGRRQSVSIRPQGGELQVTRVDIDLTRQTER
jgi:hypothetical protein